jgi:hypothetical protein
MKLKTLLPRILIACAMLMLVSCGGGSSSTSEYDPTLSGQQQKNLALAEVKSDAFEQILYDQLVAEGLTPKAARSVTDCVQPEAVRLIQNTPAEKFEVSESEAMKLGESLGIQAANNCLARIS